MAASARIIPARAGFTWTADRLLAAWKDHPRSRGVYFKLDEKGVAELGSSPLARGLRARSPLHGPVLRIIPARAGFTQRVRHARQWVRDHPRSRGVYPIGDRLDLRHQGSSPLARGLRTAGTPVGEGAGIIPARAGFTADEIIIGNERQDHPRSRGVYCPSVRVSGTMSGSSPLARGLPIGS